MWLALSKEMRAQLAKDFNLVQSGGCEVFDNEVISDGYTINDLLGINRKTMETYVGSKEEWIKLWELTVSKAKSILYPPINLKEKVEETIQEEKVKGKKKFTNKEEEEF